MAKVLCNLPNASTEISGIKFVSHANGMLSEDITDEQAATFSSIPGYSVVGAAPAAEAGERAELAARGEAVGLKIKATWGNDRLKSEVEVAERAAAEAKAAEAGAAK